MKNFNDLLDMKIWYGPRLMEITGVKLLEVEMPQYGLSNKLVFSIKDVQGNPFSISDIWIKDKNDTLGIMGLWFQYDEIGNKVHIKANSSIAKLMEYYSCESIRGFIGKTVEVFPDDRNFLALVATEMN